jgi:hypothetical protein
LMTVMACFGVSRDRRVWVPEGACLVATAANGTFPTQLRLNKLPLLTDFNLELGEVLHEEDWLTSSKLNGGASSAR